MHLPGMPQFKLQSVPFKQLPVSGKQNVVTFLMLGVVLLQVAMLVNSIWGLPLKNITHLITVFR